MLTISQVTKAFGGRTLFEDASLQVNRGDRVGLVGPNGAGKSTLFSLILGEASPDIGKVSVEKAASVGFLPQENAPVGGLRHGRIARAFSNSRMVGAPNASSARTWVGARTGVASKH
jgi:ATPase subunit of ABC transporter with duplicated ATPase domains